MMRRPRPEGVLLGLLLVFSACVDLAWYSYTGFLRDDAWITFRYAQNIANGQGFVYNVGERVYGTSSPGMALLLAAWLKMFPAQPAAGAVGLDILASTLSLLLVWKLLEKLPVPTGQRAAILFILIWSDKVLVHGLEGMETPLVITCMLASLYFMVQEKPIAAGTAAGLMLWLRLDSGIWLAVLAAVGLLRWRWNTSVLLVTAALTYLPWCVFAWSYFGSLIPQTVIAKQAAYAIHEQPWLNRSDVLFRWLTPFSLPDNPYVARVANLLAMACAALGAWTYRQQAWLRVAALFFIAQSAVLIALNMTVDERYFATDLYVLLLLFGLGVSAVWEYASRRLNAGSIWASGLVVIYACAAFGLALPRIQHLRDDQRYIYEASLKQLGIWVQQNTARESVVYLEPLGYAGYYAVRTMRDDVGLLTPQVVPLKRAGLNSFEIIERLQPDYVVLHCDDAKRAPPGFGYWMQARFDPLGFEAAAPWADKPIQRNACYEVEARIGAH